MFGKFQYLDNIHIQYSWKNLTSILIKKIEFVFLNLLMIKKEKNS